MVTAYPLRLACHTPVGRLAVLPQSDLEERAWATEARSPSRTGRGSCEPRPGPWRRSRQSWVCRRAPCPLWVRDVEFDEAALRDASEGPTGRPAPVDGVRTPCSAASRQQIDDSTRGPGPDRRSSSETDLLVAGTMLYAGEGAKTDGDVKLANTDPRMIEFFCRWLRHFFDIDESRLRVRLYLHEGLDLDGGNAVLVRAHRRSRSASSASRGGPCRIRRIRTCEASTRLRDGQLRVLDDPPKDHGPDGRAVILRGSIPG